MHSILELPETYRRLSPQARRRFDSIFSFSIDTGRMNVPASMRPWVKKQFGSVKKVEQQPVLKITNHIMFEGALINKLRADRPIHRGAGVTKQQLLDMAKNEPFADVRKNTPEDTFGRIVGLHEISASNVAKYDALHGLIIFNKANPLEFTERETIEHYKAAMAWIEAAQSEHPEAQYPLIGWNCLWKAGASLVHGHLQVLIGRHEPYAAMHLWQEQSSEYRQRRHKSYWDELYKVYESLDLATELRGIKVFASITPRKEKEIVLMTDCADEVLFGVIYKVLKAFRAMGIESFNVATMMAPGLPVLTRIVDRGKLSTHTTDIGIAELYLNQSVIFSDPVKVWAKVKKRLNGSKKKH